MTIAMACATHEKGQRDNREPRKKPGVAILFEQLSQTHATRDADAELVPSQ